MTDSLGARTTRAGRAAGIGQAGATVVTLVATIAVTRLLVPAEIGKATMVGTLLALALLVNEITTGPALITRKDLDSETFSTAFWAQCAFSATAAVLLAVSGPAAGALFDQDLDRLMLFASAAVIAFGLDSVVRSTLARELRYHVIAVADVVGALAAAAVAVGMATAGYGASAPLAGVVSMPAAASFVMWRACRRRPTRAFSWPRFRELASFSLDTAGSRVVNYVVRNGDDIGVGALFGTQILGFYARGYQILLVPVSRVSGEVGRVMVPALAQLRDDPSAMGRNHLRGLHALSLLNLPALAAVAVSAPDLVAVLFGSAWAPASTFVQIFALAGMLDSVSTTVGWMYLASGRSREMLRTTLLLAPILLTGIALGLALGSAEAVALCYLGATTIASPIALHLGLAPFGVSAYDLWLAVSPGALTAAAVAGSAFAMRVLSEGCAEPLRLALTLGVAGGVWCVSLWLQGDARGIVRGFLPRRPT